MDFLHMVIGLSLTFTLLIIPGHSYKTPANPHLYNKTTPEMAVRDGYPMEAHYVTTSDGYILGVFRIPYTNVSASAPSTKPKPVVILHHGIGASSSVWQINSPGKRLPYLLADAGYDVWLANGRGNMYSRNHTHLSPEEKPFWQFSCQEMALFDLPALIDYALDKTGQKKLSYIGQSMGTTIYFMLASAIPSYNEKINVAIALAPIAFAGHMKSPPAALLSPLLLEPGPATEVVSDLFSLGSGEFVSNIEWRQKLMILVCSPFLFAFAACSLPLFVTYGFDYSQLDASITDDIWGHYPQGTAVKVFVHYGQLINSGRFCMYDHGIVKNRKIYNSDSPPDFPLENISAPLVLMAGPNDQLATSKDLAILRSRLTGVNETFIYVDYAEFNHNDFLLAIDANKYVNYPVIKILNKRNGLE
ncbi:unnamed protein product [Allacma fusca]|uniref:Lipase n=1 Tax=Allacma fusca TaxID=39272 RepID=A0A8J2NMN8_9HEXA|nr:unnamed protein product [Allacma fusca]